MLPMTHSQFRGLVLCSSILLVGAVLVACTPMSRSEFESPSSNSDLPVATVTVGFGYPGPEDTPAPTLPIVSHNSLIATPLPGERVVAGAIIEMHESKDKLPYTYREDYIYKDGIGLGRIFVLYQGQEIRLGDDNGSSNVEVANDKYLVWWYHGRGDETSRPLKSGLYVYEIRTGKLTHIADGWKVGLSEVDGEWVLYTSWENAPPVTPTLVGEDMLFDLVSLIAYHIASGTTITLSTSLPVMGGHAASGFYGVGGNRAGWVEYDMQTQQYAIKVSNLDSGQIQTLKVPDLKQPRFFSISGDLAVWRDDYWHGYSLAHDALFTVPYAPPGWETSEASIMVSAKNSMLEWEVRVSESERRYFNAPVIPYGHGPTAWDSLVIPFQQTIAPPTPPPLESAPPTAYP